MGKKKKYRKAILKILKKFSKIKFCNFDGSNLLVADRKNHHYLILTVGRYNSGSDKGVFAHDSPLHFDILNGKIWVQRNMTEWDVGEMLEKSGISKKEIVIGFLSPTMREFSEYAVA